MRPLFHADGDGDAMVGGAQGVVCPALQGVADIDDHFGLVFAFDGDEGAVEGLVFDFQPAGRVLEEQSHGAEIGVFGDAACFAVFEPADVDGWVVG